MYFRQQAYPRSRLISYKITPNQSLWECPVTVSEVAHCFPTGCESVRLLMGPQESIMNRTEIMLEIAELHKEQVAFHAALKRNQACVDELIRALNRLEEQDPMDCDTPMAEMMGG